MEAVFGLKVNLGNSKLYPVGDVSNLGELASIMGWDMENFPTTYLRLPLGVKSTSKEIWNLSLKEWRRDFQAGKEGFFPKGVSCYFCEVFYQLSQFISCLYMLL